MPDQPDAFQIGAERVVSRIGGVGVYATPADMTAFLRTRSERVMRTLLTFAGTCLAAPLGFLIPPHLEPAVVVFVLGLYFTRRAWVAEWEVVHMSGTCSRCEAPLSLKRGTVLYLPHSIRCGSCHAELWLEVGAAPVVEEALRRGAIAKMTEKHVAGELDGRPPQTWSPAASNWRDRRRSGDQL